LRANRLRTDRDRLAGLLAEQGVEVEPTRFSPDGLLVKSGNPLLSPLASAGLFVVQDEASQLVALFAAAQPGEHILDACASPGGKTTAMAAAMGNRGLIVATDVRGRRVDLLAETVRRSGASRVAIVRADISAALPFGAAFDCVLLDAPCSGLGTLRRDPDIKWRRTADELATRQAVQLDMLEHCANGLRPGGRLIYATCSSEPEENEDAVSTFLDRHPDFAESREIAPGLQRFLTPAGHFRTLPFRDRLEAFFAAMLVKTKDLR
jgi:16S rRNA (cytosine967-C5)-methyltransferase